MTDEGILQLCPRLVGDPAYGRTSLPEKTYNCFAWAAGETNRCWDPAPVLAPTRAGLYWPAGVPLLPSLGAFVAAYETIGYRAVQDGTLEDGLEKVALYASDSGEIVHAARQLSDGTWTSKLGRADDIRHGTPQGVENTIYGRVIQYLARPQAS